MHRILSPLAMVIAAVTALPAQQQGRAAAAGVQLGKPATMLLLAMQKKASLTRGAARFSRCQHCRVRLWMLHVSQFSP
jgi:hypothetical protein